MSVRDHYHYGRARLAYLRHAAWRMIAGALFDLATRASYGAVYREHHGGFTRRSRRGWRYIAARTLYGIVGFGGMVSLYGWRTAVRESRYGWRIRLARYRFDAWREERRRRRLWGKRQKTLYGLADRLRFAEREAATALDLQPGDAPFDPDDLELDPLALQLAGFGHDPAEYEVVPVEGADGPVAVRVGLTHASVRGIDFDLDDD